MSDRSYAFRFSRNRFFIELQAREQSISLICNADLADTKSFVRGFCESWESGAVGQLYDQGFDVTHVFDICRKHAPSMGERDWSAYERRRDLVDDAYNAYERFRRALRRMNKFLNPLKVIVTKKPNILDVSDLTSAIWPADEERIADLEATFGWPLRSLARALHARSSRGRPGDDSQNSFITTMAELSSEQVKGHEDLLMCELFNITFQTKLDLEAYRVRRQRLLRARRKTQKQQPKGTI